MEGRYIVPALKKKNKSHDVERESWDELRRRINGLVNKVNTNNLRHVVLELLEENLIRGRGLLCRSCIKSQIASPLFSDVIAALIAVVNSRFPLIGDLLLRRLVLQIQKAYDRNDKPRLLAVVRFLAHLVNQRVVNETIALELLLKLLVEPTGDTVEVAVVFVTECGALLQEVSPRGLNLIFDSFRRILHEGDLEYRSRCLIESLVTLRRLNFKDHPAIRPQLDLVDLENQVTHEIFFFDDIDPETSLDVFKPDPAFQQNESKYELMKKQILGEEDLDLEEEEEEEEEDKDDDDDDERVIKDDTDTDLVNLRRTIYQTIMSSLDFEEAGHKLLKIRLEQGQEMELCVMVLECCTEEKTYRSFYGHLAHRFCLRSKVYRECFENLFVQQYSMVHRFETNKLISVATFFGHLLATDALPWHVLSYVQLTEEDTTSSSRIFLKNLFLQRLSELLGIKLLNEKLHDPTMEETFESIFPKDHLKNTLFSINFFTKIGLGGITQKLRQFIAKRKETDSEESSGDDGTKRKRRRKRG
ncbi:LOW QUALITY PROTEIN: pre-mRNA-splicing factor CWC22 homolog [Arabidopsis lyrata subsp. lyrata]|uniref:LOW QUALITY PROTEIN: pre-mRNA-splicing factor CWC22 homolog n=1 Tax=Arabidopsis lyrata subsp. lyrata TaxID=81972 RepID=UPI000A29AB9D|nr:LOW QUALITY PROTEIN: pre-mRNA-splicing factor CWC22 homolog [Arabidopsis lyrata subsp. lyrata]|eukprot:XP_020868205.1 LOW QUALITY PROTEIN: pre-mRNA-splicing factor CWC22 homolog [Arabidopsis lyrata subsp. lyrata]